MTTAIDWKAAKAALAEPFDPKFVKFRPGREVGSQSAALAYIDGRAVMDTFDRIFGPDAWAFDYDVLQWGADKNGKPIALFVRGTITVAGVAKSDIGEASNASPSKGAVSDALKRAAVLWGVGRYLYDHPVGLVTLDKYRHITPADMARLRAKLPRPGDAYVDAEEDGEEEAVEHKAEHKTERQTETKASTAATVRDVAPVDARTDAVRIEISKRNRAIAKELGLEDRPAHDGEPPVWKYSRAYATFVGVEFTPGKAILSTDEQVDDWTAHLNDLKAERDRRLADGKLADWHPDVPEGDEPISFELSTHPALSAAGRSN